jgi:hypothetical protein
MIESNSLQPNKPAVLLPSGTVVPDSKPSRVKIGIAFAVAAVSDILSFVTEFVPLAQWALDGATALILFFILGRRWALLPGLIAEAIPGMGIFPVWVLVVASIAVYDGIKKPHRI